MKRIGNTNSFLKTVPVMQYWGGSSFSTHWQDVIVHGGGDLPDTDIILHYKLCNPETEEDKQLGVIVKHSEEYAKELIEKREPYEWNGRKWEIYKFKSDAISYGNWMYIEEVDRQKKEAEAEWRRFMEMARQEAEYHKLSSRLKRGLAKINQMRKRPSVSGALSIVGALLACAGVWMCWLIISDLIA